MRLEFFIDPKVEDPRLRFTGGRPWTVVGFFVLLGLTNLAKGPVVGAAVIVGSIGAYFLMPALVWRRGNLGVFFAWPAQEGRRVRRYVWLWGWLAAAVIRGWKGVVEFSAESARQNLTLWPEPGGDFAIMREVKRMFDPGNLLNRGRLYSRL